MPEAKQIYKIQTLTVEQLNWVLAQISDRIDQIEGVRGSSDYEYSDSSQTVLHGFGDVP